jgi:hypothetical protein
MRKEYDFSKGKMNPFVWKPIDPTCGVLFTLESFAEAVKSGELVDDDGSAEWATETLCLKHSLLQSREWDFSPSTFLKAKRPVKATHVVWYNK